MCLMKESSYLDSGDATWISIDMPCIPCRLLLKTILFCLWWRKFFVILNHGINQGVWLALCVEGMPRVEVGKKADGGRGRRGREMKGWRKSMNRNLLSFWIKLPQRNRCWHQERDLCSWVSFYDFCRMPEKIVSREFYPSLPDPISSLKIFSITS